MSRKTVTKIYFVCHLCNDESALNNVCTTAFLLEHNCQRINMNFEELFCKKQIWDCTKGGGEEGKRHAPRSLLIYARTGLRLTRVFNNFSHSAPYLHRVYHLSDTVTPHQLIAFGTYLSRKFCWLMDMNYRVPLSYAVLAFIDLT